MTKNAIVYSLCVCDEIPNREGELLRAWTKLTIFVDHTAKEWMKRRPNVFLDAEKTMAEVCIEYGLQQLRCRHKRNL